MDGADLTTSANVDGGGLWHGADIGADSVDGADIW